MNLIKKKTGGDFIGVSDNWLYGEELIMRVAKDGSQASDDHNWVIVGIIRKN